MPQTLLEKGTEFTLSISLYLPDMFLTTEKSKLVKALKVQLEETFCLKIILVDIGV